MVNLRAELGSNAVSGVNVIGLGKNCLAERDVIAHGVPFVEGGRWKVEGGRVLGICSSAMSVERGGDEGIEGGGEANSLLTVLGCNVKELVEGGLIFDSGEFCHDDGSILLLV